ncbi:transcription factor IIIC subunit delta N-term-domain-containing protein [Infundibulicybe gibba]|nr:transcription factor IIIC subunit delta N-term-domain-containing protein [Infundibulicybe gibba]
MAPRTYSSLNVPTVTSSPSTTCLQWSADGQLCFATKSAVYIMTPDLGINLGKMKSEDHQIGWFKTAIQFDRSTACKWPEYSQAWGAVSLGSIDVSLWALAISPSGLSPQAGCILATLSSNMDLTLWAATKNYLKGEWVKLLDVTGILLGLFSTDTSNVHVTQVLQAQITCITWSSQANFDMKPALLKDTSLLICGNRGGSIIFLRYQEQPTIQHIYTAPVSDEWITKLASSSWTVTSSEECESSLAYSTASGAIGVMKVTQVLAAPSPSMPSQSCPEISLSVENNPEWLYAPDNSGVSALIWIEKPNILILAHAKPGFIYLWSRPTNPGGMWTGHRKFPLKNQRVSIGSSSLHLVTGMVYLDGNDILVITLLDGSFHVIHSITTEPCWGPIPDDPFDSGNLSNHARSLFRHVEDRAVEHEDVNKITGVVSYDSLSTFVWAQEASRPSDFSYKHDAKHNSTLILAQLWDSERDNVFLAELKSILARKNSGFCVAPLHVLRPALFYIRFSGKLEILLEQILNILPPEKIDDLSNITPWVESLTIKMRREFKTSLTAHLFGWDDIVSLRMRLSVADFIWKISSSEEKQAQCGLVAQSLLNTISHHTLRIVIRHIAAVAKMLTPSDLPFVQRTIMQSLMQGSPEDIAEEGRNLLAAIEDAMPGTIVNLLGETCPACKEEVPINNITTAICPNGHCWARCSITTFILSVPTVRTCIGCSRKALLPASKTSLPRPVQSWVVEDLLEAVPRCLFCNNSFITVL